MYYKRDILSLNPYVPFTVSLIKLGAFENQWAEAEIVIFQVGGTTKMVVDGVTVKMAEGDVGVINSGSTFSLFGDDSFALIVQLDVSNFGKLPAGYKGIYFSVPDSKTSKSGLAEIKSKLAKILRTSFEGDVFLIPKLVAQAYDFLYVLCEKYANPGFSGKEVSGNYDLIREMFLYINDNYKNKLTLESIASHFGLTQPYFSRLFKKLIGQNFHDYLCEVRLNHAAKDLLTSNAKIETISASNGFPSIRPFTALFKKRFGCLPSIYREKDSFIKLDRSFKKVNLSSYAEKDITMVNDFINSNGGLPDTSRAGNGGGLVPISKINVEINSIRPIDHFHKTFRKIMGISSTDDILNDSIKKEMVKAQEDIDFEYVKLANIFDDRLMVCQIKGDSVIYNFSLLDQVIDFCLSIKLKPLIQFSFMPRALAKDSNRKALFRVSQKALPNGAI